MAIEVDAIVTRHPALADWLRTDCGIISDCVIPDASINDVQGKVVAGALPLCLASVCHEVYLVDLALPADRPDKELELTEIRAQQPELRRYSVLDLTESADYPPLGLEFDGGLPYNDLLCMLGFSLGWQVQSILQKRYDAGGRDFAWAQLNGMTLSGTKLAKAALRGANLRGVDLSSSDLGDADLSGADLSGANLHSANLQGADLSGAKLKGADLVCADLRNANLANADLSAADLSCADLMDADLSAANLRGTTGFWAEFTELRGANFSGADIAGTGLEVDGQLAKFLEMPPVWERAGLSATEADWERFKQFHGALHDPERPAYLTRSQTLRCAVRILVDMMSGQDPDRSVELIEARRVLADVLNSDTTTKRTSGAVLDVSGFTKTDWKRLDWLRTVLSDREHGSYPSNHTIIRTALMISAGAVTNQDRELALQLVNTGTV